MVSVIISSADSQMLQQVKLNIDKTIGVPYEILAFDNADGAKGICEIYNEGIANAAYDIMCFMHEDIAMLTNEWGKKLKDLFSRHSKLGIIGIAGATFKSVMPSGWLSPRSRNIERSHMWQSFKFKNHKPFLLT